MAHNGFCSNAQIIKSIKKKLKNTGVFLVTPEQLFLEEFLIFLEETSGVNGHTSPVIIEKGKQKYYNLKMAERMRYIKLAQEINAWASTNQAN